MAETEVIFFPSADELLQAMASAWLSETGLAPQKDRNYGVALSGGRSAEPLFAEFSRQAAERKPPFTRVHFFWADERCVPPNDQASNYRVAAEHLFVPLGIAADRIHRIRGEFDPNLAAREASAELCRLAPRAANGQPVLDLVLLSMGEDGHVASLFPGQPEAAASSPTPYRAVVASKPPPRRVTLGYGALAAAQEVWVVISGAGKEAALRGSLEPEGGTPLARVIRSRSRTRIFTDLRNPRCGC
jgi:6-phosphogluconolactonase